MSQSGTGNPDATRRMLETLYLSVIASLNPAERTSRALAEIEWNPRKTVLIAAGKAALSMASGALTHLTEIEAAIAGGVVIGPEHALLAPQFSPMGIDPDMMSLADDLAAFEAELQAQDDESSESAKTDAGDSDDAKAKADDDAEPEAKADADAKADAKADANADADANAEPASRTGEWPIVCTGGHPVPDQRSMLAAAHACDAVVHAPTDAEVLVLISGGASALMAMPAPGLSLEDKNTVVNAVAKAGADRQTINMVRKHMSAIKGGQLATMSAAPMTTLIVSNLIGDDVTAVGSGPTMPDLSTIRQACDVVAGAMGWGAIPWRVRAYFESVLAGEIPDTPTSVREEDQVALLTGTTALVDSAVLAAQQAGMTAKPFARDLVGDVNHVAQRIAVQVHRIAAAGTGRKLCLVGGGEPTVALSTPSGIGGRAQHLALLVAREIQGLQGVTVLAACSDGIDGNSDAAGAVIDGSTWDAIIAAGIDPERALAFCDSGSALAAAGATLVTGATEINHADLIMILSGV